MNTSNILKLTFALGLGYAAILSPCLAQPASPVLGFNTEQFNGGTTGDLAVDAAIKSLRPSPQHSSNRLNARSRHMRFIHNHMDRLQIMGGADVIPM